MPRPRTLVAATAALACLASLSGCTGGTDQETPQQAAGALASALAGGRLGAVPFAGTGGRQARTWWHDAVAGMGTAPRTVTVGTVTEDHDQARATLHYRWTLPGGTWAYDTTAALERGPAGRWLTKLAPTLLAPTLRPGDRLTLDTTAAPRADILGDGGVRLVTDRPVYRFGIDKTRVRPPQQAASARRLAALLGVDANAFADRVKASSPQAFVEAIVLRTADATPRIMRGYKTIIGAIVIPDAMPLAPTREFARPLLGTVGPVTAEMVKASHGAYQAGDEGGLSGLEQRYDGQLRGTPGVAVRAVPAKGKPRVLFSTRPTAGTPLRTTLQPRLQALAERALSGVGPASAVVVLRPSDGNVLAAASGPGSQGYSTATLGRYAPGSTFKVVSSLALLRSGLTTGSILPCTPTIVVDGKQFKNYSDYPASGIGRIPLRTAVANSCNTAFISLHDRVSGSQLSAAAATLGLGVDHDLGFPVFLGSVPPAASATEHAADLIGQGRVLASPTAMAAVAASVAAGRTVVPRLLPAEQPGATKPGRPLTAGEAADLRSLMRGVVTSGSGSFLAGLPGPPVLAKTGTAEFGDHRPPQTHTWMIAVHGDLAVAVFVDVGQSGSQTAGPILEQVLRGAG